MATVFTVETRNTMLDRLSAFVTPASGFVADGFSVHAYPSQNAVGAIIASAQINLGSANNGQRVNTNQPTMTIPESSTVRSIGFGTYDGLVNQNVSLIGYKNISPALEYTSIGTLQITGLTISINNPV